MVLRLDRLARTRRVRSLAAIYGRVAEGGGLQLLLGRRSYEGMLGYWNTQDSPFKDGLNNAPKYVASRTLSRAAPLAQLDPPQGKRRRSCRPTQARPERA